MLEAAVVAPQIIAEVLVVEMAALAVVGMVGFIVVVAVI
jgi:hypothetical protein